jgi:hypothetical protein
MEDVRSMEGLGVFEFTEHYLGKAGMADKTCSWRGKIAEDRSLCEVGEECSTDVLTRLKSGSEPLVARAEARVKMARAEVIDLFKHLAPKCAWSASAAPDAKHSLKVAVGHHLIQFGWHQVIEELDETLSELGVTPGGGGGCQALRCNYVENAGDRVTLLVNCSIKRQKSRAKPLKVVKSAGIRNLTEYVEGDVLSYKRENRLVEPARFEF